MKSDTRPTRKNPEQTASVEINSSRVEQSRASPARIQSANNINSPAGAILQSTPVPKDWSLPSLSKKLMTKKARVARLTTPKTASDTNGRRSKQLLNPRHP